MPRFYTEISKEDFIKEVEKLIMGRDEADAGAGPDDYDDYEDEFPWNMPEKLGKDLNKKVSFDWENYTTPGPYQKPYANYPFVGYKELKPGFHVYFMQAGGDWEFPVCFIFYWGKGKLRGYVPKDGNAWNKEEKCAYGSDNTDTDRDFEKIAKEVDGELMIADILNRITKKP